KPAGALSHAVVWPAREAFASESQAGRNKNWGCASGLPLDRRGFFCYALRFTVISCTMLGSCEGEGVVFMGFMSSLRSFGRRRPAWGIALTAVLVLGLVAGYAVWTPLAGVSSQQPGQVDAAKELEEWQKAVRDQISQREAEIAELEKQLEDKPQDADLWLKLGDTRYALGYLYLMSENDGAKAEGVFKEALESYEKVRELNPAEKGVFLRIANTAVFLGDNERAEAGYREAVAADPADNNARMSYALFLAMAKEDYDGAIAQWQKILENSPEPDLADQVRQFIEQAEEMKKTASTPAQ
ncbi:MAG TPA: hypothetical protein DEA73_06570, partial [Peptococcaceae bacterium]|nr:hypothetical protein [Peptococcaceae bacterium]